MCPSLSQQPDRVIVAHFLGKVQRCIVGTVTGVDAGSAHKYIPQNLGSGTDSCEMHGCVTGIVGLFEELVIELVTFENFSDSLRVAIPYSIAKCRKGRLW